MFYVYIIRSITSGIFYKGFTTQPEIRLREHNEGQSNFTRGKGPWELVYLEEFTTKREALIRERQIKKYNTNYLSILISKYKNKN